MNTMHISASHNNLSRRFGTVHVALEALHHACAPSRPPTGAYISISTKPPFLRCQNHSKRSYGARTACNRRHLVCKAEATQSNVRVPTSFCRDEACIGPPALHVNDKFVLMQGSGVAPDSVSVILLAGGSGKRMGVSCCSACIWCGRVHLVEVTKIWDALSGRQGG